MNKGKIEEIFNELLEAWYMTEFCFPDISEDDINSIKKEKELYKQRFLDALNE